MRRLVSLCSSQASQCAWRRPLSRPLEELEAILADIAEGATLRDWAPTAAATLEALARSAANHEFIASTDAIHVLVGVARVAAADTRSGMSLVALRGAQTLTAVGRALRCARAWALTGWNRLCVHMRAW